MAKELKDADLAKVAGGACGKSGKSNPKMRNPKAAPKKAKRRCR
jgi:hypothetical protein